MDYYDEIHSDEMHTKEIFEKKDVDTTMASIIKLQVSAKNELVINLINELTLNLDNWICKSTILDLIQENRREKMYSIMKETCSKYGIELLE